ncbi:Alpha-taxilin [Portunus trituberculatus]|uniref:Alpha-taxilin n=1 Tax=Portunus trituberculatus TaxID=210409 RepID=A0A5B7D1H9_PORTR|nr:Alpha-taxilin [Portunus trituberculatus]
MFLKDFQRPIVCISYDTIKWQKNVTNPLDATEIKSNCNSTTIMAETKSNKQLTHKKDKKVKERDGGVKAITAALKALPLEEQVSTLLAKYAEMAEENKRLQMSTKTVERQVQVLQRDKDQLESEHTKVILAKSKLESLCRELQKQNKLIKEVAAYQKKTQEMSLNEISLRTQLNSYMEKYEDFQKTLEKSNQIFHTFKKEMEEVSSQGKTDPKGFCHVCEIKNRETIGPLKTADGELMAKKIKKTEKDTKSWKERCEGANKALLEMVTERSLLEKQLDLQVKQNKQLQNLCRALQQQLTEIRKQDKNNAEPECKDPEQISQEKSALVEDSTGKNINPLENEDFTVEETNFPVTMEVALNPEESIALETENDESKDSCDVTIAKDHVEVIEQTAEVGVNGGFVGEDNVEVTEKNSNVKADQDAVTEDHIEVIEHSTENIQLPMLLHRMALPTSDGDLEVSYY